MNRVDTVLVTVSGSVISKKRCAAGAHPGGHTPSPLAVLPKKREAINDLPRRIERIMIETGMGAMQARNHLVQRDELIRRGRHRFLCPRPEEAFRAVVGAGL